MTLDNEKDRTLLLELISKASFSYGLIDHIQELVKAVKEADLEEEETDDG